MLVVIGADALLLQAEPMLFKLYRLSEAGMQVATGVERRWYLWSGWLLLEWAFCCRFLVYEERDGGGSVLVSSVQRN